MLNAKEIKFHYFDNTNTDAALNLAIESVLLDCEFTKENALFMLWQNAPSVIIGRHQNAFEEVDLPYLKDNNIALIRRPTGGGAVFHDLGNLNFTFIIPTTSTKLDFHLFLAPMIEAFNKIGIKAKTTGRNDIQIFDKKFCGTAQTKGKHAILLHGSMLLDVDLDILEHVLAGNPDKYTSKGIASVRSRVINIKEVLLSETNKEYSKEECVNHIKNTLRDYFVPNHDQKEFTVEQSTIDEVIAKAKELAQERYSNDDWTYKRSPAFTSSLRKKFSFGSVKVNYQVTNGIIKACSLEGDFFALKDVEIIEKSLIGIDYDSQKISQILLDFNFAEYILNANNEELIALFSEC